MNHVKFEHFVNFSFIFFGQKFLAPLKLTELLRLCYPLSQLGVLHIMETFLLHRLIVGLDVTKTKSRQ